MHTTYSVKQLLLGLALVGGVVTSSATSQASPEFPGAMQIAGGMPCVPLCTLCHTSNPGTSQTWSSKTLPLQLVGHGVKIGDADSAKAAYQAYLSDGTVDINERMKTQADVRAGHDQTGADICGPTYGCAFAQTLPAPKRDLMGPLWVVGAMVVGGILRRRKPSH